MSDTIKEITMDKAHELYGNPLPKEVQERLELELKSINSNGFDIVYWILMKLVDKSKEYGYPIGNRGSIGSSFVAYLLNITECNPLPREYNGFNIPFEIFAGVNFNKTLDITLNVAQDIHKSICEYLDELLKEIYKTSEYIENNDYCTDFKRSIVTKEGKELATISIVTHSLLTPLKELWNLTNIEPRKVLLDEKKEEVIKIVDLLIKEQFYSSVDLEVLSDIKSKIAIDDIDKLVELVGVLFGTGKNTQDAIIENISTDLLQIISSRDDIMVYLMQNKIERKQAYDIMENVRKGKGITEEMEVIMQKHNIPDWYIELCNKINYIFPKAHNVDRAMLEYKVAWYGVHYPEEYEQVMKKWN